MVEKNSADYAAYLRNVFPGDADFWDVLPTSGQAKRSSMATCSAAGPRWPTRRSISPPASGGSRTVSDFRFTSPSRSAARAGVLVARCVVEVGTSSIYTSLADAADEPVLHAICLKIAADEFRHYKLFYTHLKRYLDMERPSAFSKLRVAVGRIIESDDDELAYAYYAANNEGEPYERRRNADAYAARAFRFYRPDVVERGVAMTFKAAGFNPQGRIARLASKAAWRFMDWRQKRLAQTQNQAAA